MTPVQGLSTTKAGHREGPLVFHATKRLKELRALTGMTQQMLAKRLKTGQAAVSRLEAGEPMRAKRAQAVSKVFGRSLEQAIEQKLIRKGSNGKR